LTKKPAQCLEYLVVHELIHLIEPHHNERLISLLNQHPNGGCTGRRGGKG
jgi:predicted metal-dependent hydrolase